MSDFDLVVVGGGPAGMGAALKACELGLSVALVDEQPQPGGQIYRAVERAHQQGRADALGEAYTYGLELVRAFRSCGAAYFPLHQVWQVESDGRVYVSDGTRSRCLRGQRVLIAVGAMERPVPIPGWTLPGVMTVGAAQILLKTAGVLPSGQTWIAGSGPLVLAYAAQVVAAGGKLEGVLDTTHLSPARAGLGHFTGVMRGWRYVLKGLAYMRALRRAGVQMIKGVQAIEARGEGRLRAVRYQVDGVWNVCAAENLLLHEGVIPHTHMTQSIGCAHHWDAAQMCMRPSTDEFGATSLERIYVAGDCAGIGGDRAAQEQGKLAAVGIWASLMGVDARKRDSVAKAERRRHATHLAIRGFLDALYAPPQALLTPQDDVIICRCESVTARKVRDAVALGCTGPNQVKTFTRCGMGPCQGRMCGPTISSVVAHALGQPMQLAGTFRIRPPLKPLRLGELASVAEEDR